MDEQWSFVGSKKNPHCIFYTIDYTKNIILAYAFGRRQDSVFKVLKKYLAPSPITHFYTNDWATYERYQKAEKHRVGKADIQEIKSKNLNLRTWIKRLARKTIYFSKSEVLHDIMIGLLINHKKFGRDIYT